MKNDREISQAAARLSALGASKGGKASAAALTPEQRQDRARKAIAARWAKRDAARALELELSTPAAQPRKQRRSRQS